MTWGESEAPAKTEPCHTVPTFGCGGCIERDRTAADQLEFQNWAKSFKPTVCGRCRKPQKPYVWSRVNGKLVGIASCSTMTEEGTFDCEDFDLVVHLP